MQDDEGPDVDDAGQPQQDATGGGVRRRSVLRAAGAAAVAATAGVGLRPATADPTQGGGGPFRHGVASGDPTPHRVVLWTRVTPPSESARVVVRWVVARDLDLRDVVASGAVGTDASRDFTVKVDPVLPEADTHFFYAFEALGARSETGRTRTAPSGAVTRSVRFGVASCANLTGGFFNAYATMARRNDLDAVVHLGDYLYEYGNGADRYGPSEPGDKSRVAAERRHDPDGETTTLSDYRRRHANYKQDPDLRRLHQLFPFIAVWDDHESTDNSRTRSALNHTEGVEGTDGTWATRRREAQQAYVEWMPVRTTRDDAIYRTFRYGDLLDLVMLDTRLEGRDDEAGSTLRTITADELDDPARRLVSEQQEAFLYAALDRPGVSWKVLGQQVIMGQWNAGGLPELLGRYGPLPVQDSPDFLPVRDKGNTINPDQWDGYPAQRDRLFAHVRGYDQLGPAQLAQPPANRVQDLVVLTGDVHTSWALDLHENPQGRAGVPAYERATGTGALGVEFVTPSVTSGNFEGLGDAGVAAFEATARNPVDNPHVKWVDFASHGYLVLDVSHARVQADWYHVDTVLQPSTTERHGASWRVLRGAGHLDAAGYVSGAPGPAPAGDAGAPVPPPASGR